MKIGTLVKRKPPEGRDAYPWEHWEYTFTVVGVDEMVSRVPTPNPSYICEIYRGGLINSERMSCDDDRLIVVEEPKTIGDIIYTYNTPSYVDDTIGISLGRNGKTTAIRTYHWEHKNIALSNRNARIYRVRK